VHEDEGPAVVRSNEDQAVGGAKRVRREKVVFEIPRREPNGVIDAGGSIVPPGRKNALST